MKLLGLDYGSLTVGVAVSDALQMRAWPREIIRRGRENQLRRTLVRITEIIRDEEIGRIVVGLPLNMDGSEGERARAARAFRDLLAKRTSVPIVMQDERLTTVEADEIMDEMGIRDRAARKEQVDAIAAAVILNDYMEQHRITTEDKTKEE